MSNQALRLVSFLISKLSDRTLDRMTLKLARLMFACGFRKGLLRANIRRALGSEIGSTEVDAIAIKSMQSLMLTALELFEGAHRNLATNVELQNKTILTDALKEGRGCLVMCTHTANWEALAAAVSQNIAPSYVPVKKVGGKSINNFITDIRKNYGLHTEERKKKGDSFAIIQKTLARGHIVGFMQDQARPGSPRMPFFGHPAKTNVSMAAIWGKLQVPVVPAVARRIGPRKHTVEFFPALAMKNSGDMDNDILHNAAIMNQQVEKMILLNPSQFLWLHNRWK